MLTLYSMTKHLVLGRAVAELLTLWQGLAGCLYELYAWRDTQIPSF